MKKIIISTESGADLPKELADKYQIYTVPMHVVMDDKDYLDGSLPVKDIFSYYDRTKKIPSTTSTNAHEYTDLFRRIEKEHPGAAIVHIGYTSMASSSFQNAMIAAADFNNIVLIDTLNVTGGLAALVLYGAQLIEQEPNIELAKLVTMVEERVPKTRLAFIPGNLEYLRAGGRVTNTAYLGGTLLKIKPLIELVDGKLVSTKKYRGKMEKVAEKVLRDYMETYQVDRDMLYLIYSIGLDEQIKKHLEKVAEEFNFASITWIEAGGVISTHAGPGAFGVAGFERS